MILIMILLPKINRKSKKVLFLITTLLIGGKEFYLSLGNPYIKLTGSVSVCVCVPKDLANYSTNMVLLYNVASYRSLESL